MRCPIDGAELVMTERTGVEIDYCPQCRGVWLDRGELDKIIERSASGLVQSSAPPPTFAERDRRLDDDDYGHSPRRKKKRGGFLEDLFDF